MIMEYNRWPENRSIGIYIRQIDYPKINLLLYKFRSGMWKMSKREMKTLKKYFGDEIDQ